jgi:hypothetical protein
MLARLHRMSANSDGASEDVKEQAGQTVSLLADMDVIVRELAEGATVSSR